MPDLPPPVNEAAARTETGELKNQTQASTEQTESSTTTQSSEPPKKEESSTETKPAGAPEAYAEFKTPDGIKLEGEQLTTAQALFKEFNLTQEAAQRLVDYHTKQMQSVAGAADADFDALQTEWKTKAEADPAIGPLDGSKAKAIREDLGRALDTLNNPDLTKDFKSAMNLTGVGNHPAFIKVMAAWAKSVIEPRGVKGDGPTKESQTETGRTERPNVASAMYPNLKP